MNIFPAWQPLPNTLRRIKDDNFKNRYKALRTSSSSFIKQKSVRETIFKRDNYACCICGAKEKLEIDHIISIYRCALKEFDKICILNTVSNLRTLCNTCNSKRHPEE